MIDGIPRKNSSPRFPDFFIVGAPKCGTTTLATYLSLYSTVFFPAPREVTCHGSDLKYLRGQHTKGFDRANYLSRFYGARLDQIIGASPVWSLYSTNALAEMKADAPDARIVISLREPVSFLKAFHAQMIYSANETSPSMWDALVSERARRRGERLPTGLTILQSVYYSELPLFSSQVQRAFDVFGRDRVKVVLIDDIIHRPREVEKELCAFLELAHDPAMSINNANPRRATRSALVNKLIRRPPPALRRFAKLTPSWLRHASYQRLKQVNTVYVDKAATNQSDLREAELRLRYLDEVDRLSALLERDLSAWKSGKMLE